ncbi:MAG: hypothetical protein IJ358_00450 [Clostridia bacterium]|nr:hypothetical protein [Clostridia bacterium]
MSDIAMLWNGKEWNDETLLENFKRNNSIILDCQLAIESYEDFRDEIVEDFHNLNKLWKNEKVKSVNMTDFQIYEISEDFIKRYYKLIENLGKEKFVFYNDGTVEYKV